jgi:hypothetical protein
MDIIMIKDVLKFILIITLQKHYQNSSHIFMITFKQKYALNQASSPQSQSLIALAKLKAMVQLKTE